MATDGPQLALLDVEPSWADKWRGMPGYRHEDLEPERSIVVHFRSVEDQQAFARLVGQKLTDRTRSIWYPQAEIGRYADKRYEAAKSVGPAYPVYVISKGRWESRLTVKALDAIGVPFRIVVEPQEYERYAEVIDPARILTLPFANLGQGSIPARNWVWEHALESGADRHWILDDNIGGFYRFQDNLKCPVGDGAIFRAAEEFVDRYENVALAGFQYFMFVTRKSGRIAPFTLNTRIYSCILIKNDLELRWRGRYNEDTDLSLRVLKSGLCTVLFNSFLAGKAATMTMKGGNTDELYQGNGRLLMAQSLQEQHPDVVRIVEKWGRPQHHVNYKIFRHNKLRLRPDAVVPEGEGDYEMRLRLLTDDERGRAAAAFATPIEYADAGDDESDADDEGLALDGPEPESEEEVCPSSPAVPRAAVAPPIESYSENPPPAADVSSTAPATSEPLSPSTRLADLSPRLIRYDDGAGELFGFRNVDRVREANGLRFSCPNCRAHSVVCWAPDVSEEITPGPARWRFRGTSFDDLTLDGVTAQEIVVSGDCRARLVVRNGAVNVLGVAPARARRASEVRA